jgi:hypothetical protein
MKTRTIIKAIALGLAVSGCAIFTLQGLGTTASADDGVYTDTALIASATRSGYTASGSALLDAGELFTSRDLEQSADLSEAQTLTVSDGQQITISSEGVYVLQGSAKNATVIVEADSSAKVQLVLDGLSITNDDFPCIYVKSADKVFLTTLSDSSLSVTGTFVSDGDTNTDAVIFSKDDLTLNGTGTLTVSSTDKGVSSKDDLKVTGGSYVISASSKCLEGKDSICIAGGDFSLTAGSDGLHAENDEDETLGYVYIGGGSFSVSANDDGIHGTAFVQIDGGSLQIAAAEGIEGSFVQINDGTISIQSWDDGINAANKSGAYPVCVEINGGDITIAMSAGDTDGIDANGSIAVNGGSISITGSSGFDYDGTAQLNGGTVVVNGQTLTSIPNQMMGGGFGGMGGQMGGGFGGMGGQSGSGFGGRGGRH